MKKKISILCLVLVLLFSCFTLLVACVGTNPEDPDKGDTPKTLQEKYDEFLAQLDTQTKFVLSVELTVQNNSQTMQVSMADNYAIATTSDSVNGLTMKAYSLIEDNYLTSFMMNGEQVDYYQIQYSNVPQNTLGYNVNGILVELFEFPANFLTLVKNNAQFNETQATFNLENATNGVLKINDSGDIELTFDTIMGSGIDQQCKMKMSISKLGTNTVTIPDAVKTKYEQIDDKEFDFAKLNYERYLTSGKVVVEYKDAQNKVVNTVTALLNNGILYMTDSTLMNYIAVLEKDGFYLNVTKQKATSGQGYEYTYQLTDGSNIDEIINDTLHNLNGHGTQKLSDNFEYNATTKKYHATASALEQHYDMCKSLTIDMSVKGQYTIEIEAIDSIYGSKYIKAVISNIGQAQTFNVPEDMTKYTQKFINGMLFETNGENTAKLVGIVLSEGNTIIPNQVTIDNKTYTVTEIAVEPSSYVFSGVYGNAILTIPESVTTYKPFAQYDLKEIYFDDIAHQWTVNGASEPLFVTDAVRNVQYAKQYTDVWTKVVE